MSSTRHDRIGALFLEAAPLALEVRRAFLDSRCEDDPSIADEVEELLRHRDRPDVAIKTGAIDIGAVFDAAVDADTMQPSLSGAISSVARYRIVRLLGEGGMGTVYLAEQDQPRRTVALKVMRVTFGNAERLRKRFHLETDVLGRLEHPGIARIYDAGKASVTTKDGSATVPFFAMEFVDGLPLAEYAAKERLGTRERMRLIARVAEAVGAAHRIGVVHRDIKPANVLVDQSGQPKVLDFGVARATQGDAAVTTLQTDVGQLIGTLGYMSPEQVEGDPSKVGVRSDVYALGALAYELLSGKPMVDARGKTVAEVARIIRDDDPTRLSSIDRIFRGDLDTLVAKALEKDPARRYDDASQFAADVERYLRDEPIVARPPTTLYQLSKFARRNRTLVGGVIATFVVLVAGLVGTSIGIVKATAQTKLAEEAKGRATQRFDEVRKLAHSFVFEIHDKIVDIPGSTEARKLIVSTALTYLDSLAKEADKDVTLALELSEAYLKVGQAQGYGSRANLGDRVGARASFTKAIEIRQRVVDGEPIEDSYQLSLARATNQLAMLDIADGKYDDALEGFSRGLAVRERALARDPDNPAKQREVAISLQWLANAYTDIGNAASRTGDKEAVQRAAEKSLEASRGYAAIMEKLAKPDNAGSMRDLSVAFEKVGDALGYLERYDEALERYRLSLEIREKLFAANPDSAEATSDLVASHGKVGNRLMALGQLDEAEPYLKRSYELGQKSVNADPNDVLAKMNSFVGGYRMAQLAVARYDAKKLNPTDGALFLDEAEVYAKTALEVLEALDRVGKLPENRRPWKDGARGVLTEVETRRSATP